MIKLKKKISGTKGKLLLKVNSESEKISIAFSDKIRASELNAKILTASTIVWR